MSQKLNKAVKLQLKERFWDRRSANWHTGTRIRLQGQSQSGVLSYDTLLARTSKKSYFTLEFWIILISGDFCLGTFAPSATHKMYLGCTTYKNFMHVLTVACIIRNVNSSLESLLEITSSILIDTNQDCFFNICLNTILMSYVHLKSDVWVMCRNALQTSAEATLRLRLVAKSSRYLWSAGASARFIVGFVSSQPTYSDWCVTAQRGNIVPGPSLTFGAFPLDLLGL